MALSTHRERLAMRGFSLLSTKFKEIAAWIQGLAEQELERTESTLNSPRPGDERREREMSSTHSTPTSSFLAGRSRGPVVGDGIGMGRGGASTKGRGLAEIVGLPDFFIELHARFVKLLIQLGLLLGT